MARSLSGSHTAGRQSSRCSAESSPMPHSGQLPAGRGGGLPVVSPRSRPLQASKAHGPGHPGCTIRSHVAARQAV
eukprot:12896993-Alexandrium_andersonii.AAC.1